MEIENTSKLTVSKPKSVFQKPLKADFKAIFKALSKGIGHTVVGKWEELANDSVEALSAIGLTTEIEELTFLLIRRSITKALFELVSESASGFLATTKKEDTKDLIEQLDYAILIKKTSIDKQFLDRPSELLLIKDLQKLLQRWLEKNGIAMRTAKTIASRYPTYFVYALNKEWRNNSQSYRPILEALDGPFSRASEREWGWAAYSALLQHRTQESIFDEPFSLEQIFVPLNSYYWEDTSSEFSADDRNNIKGKRRRVVVSLEKELKEWLDKSTQSDVIRVISGGPGSGKSSFARIFAAKLAKEEKLKVLFIPLHLIDATKDLVDEIGRFVRDEGMLIENPLNPESPESNLLIIFDGLDELDSQGKGAAEAARAFVREVERTLEKRNARSIMLRVLFSGRELIVQENEIEFRRPHQILTLLPYFIQDDGERKKYYDPEKLLNIDLRDRWWGKYGALIGKKYEGMPKELKRKDLDEITSQPLLNYLIALSLTRKKLDFKSNINLNSIYADLVAAVHERGYENHRVYAPIRHVKLEEFSRVLEEIGLAAWHGDGRTTTVREVEEHCRNSGLGGLLETFQEGAKAGVTRLLAAFFFRRYGQRTSGDPTFVFTHKSFGEYLAARRIVRAIEKVIRDLDRRTKEPDEGWDEKDALKYWVQICGPNDISEYLHVFLLNEMKLHSSELEEWQSLLARLFNYVLQHGMPMEQLQIRTFKEAAFQSRNAEEALLVILNACSRLSNKESIIENDIPNKFGAWFRRIQGQRIGMNSVLAFNCLSFLDLSGAVLDIGDFFHSNFHHSKLQGMRASGACFIRTNFTNADLRESIIEGANFLYADLEGANLFDAVLKGANLEKANLKKAILEKANLERANLERTILKDANLERANLERANLKKTNLERANLERSILQYANLEKANLERANLKSAILEDAKLQGANLQYANLEDANLEGVILEGARLRDAKLNKANLGRANLKEADLQYAILKGVKLLDANLEGAILESANLEGAILEGATLKGAHLNWAHLEDAKLEKANFEDADLEGGKLKGAILDGANLKGANLKWAKLEDAKLGGTNLEGANLEEAILKGANLNGANLKGGNLKGADLKDAKLEGTNLEGANLLDAKLEGAIFERAILKGAILEEAILKWAILKGAIIECL